MTGQTYVFNGIEVKLTGREATKDIPKVNRRTQVKEVVKEVRVEITPANDSDGDWKKWVEMTELFTIEDK